MKNFELTYKWFTTANSKARLGKLIIQADSKQEAIRKADMWPPLIIKVIEIQ
jgi:hypothetical protein